MNLNRFIGDKAFYRKLFAVMTPILIQNVITNFVSLLDNIMVGQVGTEPMSGVAIVNQLIFVFNLCIFGGLAGPGIFSAQFYGKNDMKGVRDTFRIKLYVAAGAVLACVGILLCFGEELISLFLHEGQEGLDLNATLNYGLDYLKVMLIQTVPFAMMNVYSSAMRETGETMLPMKAGVVAVFVNLVFNYILIFGKFGAPAMGVVGAAVATVLARFVECFIVMYYTHKHKQRHGYIVGAYESLKVPKALLKQVGVMGMPLLINELLWASGTTTLNQCYSLRGLEVVSATNISSTVSNLFFCAFFAMGTTVSIVIGQLLGAGELERAKDEDRKLIAFSVALCTVVGVIMVVLAPVIPEIYNTTDTVKDIAAKLLLVNAVMMPLHAYLNCSYFTLRSGGKTLITFVFDSGFMWVINIPVAFVISRFTDMSIVPMFAAVEGVNILKAILGFVLLKKGTWVNNLVSE